MKQLQEYKLSECIDAMNHAKLLAIGTIEHLYNTHNAEESLTDTEVHKLKNCIKILVYINTVKIS